MNAETLRLQESSRQATPWKKWGPYLSERQWGTVREDYSKDGNAWEHFSHDQARSRAYRWGEDGIAGISDDRQRLCFAVALWNGHDPILKERLFGLTNSEGNHGEDVKEYYFYLDNTPTHSYMRYLYKYPHAAYPYDQLIAENKRRSRTEPEYELLDTGIFSDNCYFDVEVEYAKASPEDILILISIHNRGADAAELHFLPTLWFRNDWTWDGKQKPSMRAGSSPPCGSSVIECEHRKLDRRIFYAEGDIPLLFTENESNQYRLFGKANPSPFVKDGINDAVVHGRTDTIHPERMGTKASPHYQFTIPAGGSQVVRLRLTDNALAKPFSSEFDNMLANRRREADEFYSSITPPALTADQALVMRQALAGMLWGKQLYFYDVGRWLDERGAGPLRHPPVSPRNEQWHHMYHADIISMPDKWEYPWYAAWDLAFHVLPFSLVDLDFSKQQLSLILSNCYLHPNGQMPAYEWNFSDVNPPVHAWATIYLYQLDKSSMGRGDRAWLKSSFDRLLINFTWWVNRKDATGRNVFQGGFLGLDNIGVFDRSQPLPTSGYLEQADGTAWMALFAQNMLEMAGELSEEDPTYSEMVVKFVQHFLWIAAALTHVGEAGDGMWDEQDGFFYDVLRLPDGKAIRLKVRSLVGLLPFCAVTVFEADRFAHVGEEIKLRYNKFIATRPELLADVHDLRKPGVAGRFMLAVVSEDRLRRILSVMLDENEFLSPFGIRSLSRKHSDEPFEFNVGDQEYQVGYLPGESDTGMFGGNSNWRGPIWLPMNALIGRALLQYHLYYGDRFTIECPTGSGHRMNLFGVAEEIARRNTQLFLRDATGRRPVHGETGLFQTDSHWRDHILFYEYFHGETGQGLGASHQTGWTGLVAKSLQLFASLQEQELQQGGRAAFFGGPSSP